ncbi:MAG TPA: hypothetical protein VIY48_10435 [Candidatus Paceibacterota bacterium]
MKKYLYLLTVVGLLLALVVGCASNDADVASKNLSTAADNFQIDRRIVFYNGITGDYILTIMGKCSLGNHDAKGELTVTCKVGPNQYKKHFLGLSDNVTYFAEQLEEVPVDVYHYQVVFKPAVIIPDIVVK